MSGNLAGHPDGMKVDLEGNVYCTRPGGIWIMNSSAGIWVRSGWHTIRGYNQSMLWRRRLDHAVFYYPQCGWPGSAKNPRRSCSKRKNIIVHAEGEKAQPRTRLRFYGSVTSTRMRSCIRGSRPSGHPAAASASSGTLAVLKKEANIRHWPWAKTNSSSCSGGNFFSSICQVSGEATALSLSSSASLMTARSIA